MRTKDFVVIRFISEDDFKHEEDYHSDEYVQKDDEGASVTRSIIKENDDNDEYDKEEDEEGTSEDMDDENENHAEDVLIYEDEDEKYKKTGEL